MPINHFLSFFFPSLFFLYRHALPGELVLVWGLEGWGLWWGSGRCTWHCGKRAIIRLLPPPAVVLCSCRAASMHRSGTTVEGFLYTARQKPFFFSSPFFISPHGYIGPGPTPVHTTARHNTFLFKCVARSENTVSFLRVRMCVGVRVCLFPSLYTRKRLWWVSGLEHPGGCKYQVSWRWVFLFLRSFVFFLSGKLTRGTK